MERGRHDGEFLYGRTDFASPPWRVLGHILFLSLPFHRGVATSTTTGQMLLGAIIEGGKNIQPASRGVHPSESVSYVLGPLQHISQLKLFLSPPPFAG